MNERVVINDSRLETREEIASLVGESSSMNMSHESCTWLVSVPASTKSSIKIEFIIKQQTRGIVALHLVSSRFVGVQFDRLELRVPAHDTTRHATKESTASHTAMARAVSFRGREP
uniref:Uncharacterized protein n=1 Tax=Pseudo-nitzschia australis TaxID=44445 RepID=A0A7S4END8_9STRA